jgi:hypothetical protein
MNIFEIGKNVTILLAYRFKVEVMMSEPGIPIDAVRKFSFLQIKTRR